MVAYCSLETAQVRRKWNNIFNDLKENAVNLAFYIQGK